MHRSAIFTFAALCGAVSLVACTGKSPSAPTPAVQPAALTVHAAAPEAASRTVAALHVFPFGAELPGSTTLTRTDSGISMTVHAVGLTANNAYTVWFVIFNNPEQCATTLCGVPDVFANRGTPSLRLAAGHVVGDSGIGDFGGQLSAGNTGGPACSSNPATLGICGPGLLDARTATIHLVVRSHGPAIPDLVNEQISSFTGACSVNGCANVQTAIHTAKPF
jgi:hypothetical protein